MAYCGFGSNILQELSLYVSFKNRITSFNASSLISGKYTIFDFASNVSCDNAALISGDIIANSVAIENDTLFADVNRVTCIVI